MRATAVINVAIDTGGTAHGSEITMEGSQRSDGGDGITWLHPPAIIILCSPSRERVESGLTTHLLKGCSDVGVNEGDRVVGVLSLCGQVVEHIEQLRATRGTVLKATCALHVIWIRVREVFVRGFTCTIADKASSASTPD